MAIKIKLIKNNIKRSSAYGKFFAKAVSQGEVSFDDIAAETCRRNGISEGTIHAVVTDMKDVVQRELCKGRTVVFPGLGRFSLRVESEGVEDPSKFSIRRHITRILCGFLPSGHRGFHRQITYEIGEGVKVEWA